MNLDILELVCDPNTHDLLEIKTEPDTRGHLQEFLVNPKTGRRFPICGGIPVFLLGGEITGPNQRYQAKYDRIAPLYDASMCVYSHWKGMSVEARCREYLSELEVTSGSFVLEVAVGTGRNLHSLPRNAKFCGLDISWGMLKQCQRKVAKWKLDAMLFMGTAERLPFRNEMFDIVFHFGGINFFNDKGAAIGEMIRVAKPGSKIVIGDENEASAHRNKKRPVAGKFYGNRNDKISAPIHLLPPQVQDVRVKDTANGNLYCLSFIKPR